MARPYPPTSSSLTPIEQTSSITTTNGTPTTYHATIPNISGFPGLSSLLQSMASQNSSAIQTPITQTPTQPAFMSQLTNQSSSSNSDLERLERLKKEILDGQNPIYKAVPQPDFLESLYLGRTLQRTGTVPAHPEQVVAAQNQVADNQVIESHSTESEPQQKNVSVTHYSPLDTSLLPSELLNLTRSKVTGLGQLTPVSQVTPDASKELQTSSSIPSSAPDKGSDLPPTDNIVKVKSEQDSSEHLLARTDTELSDEIMKYSLSSHSSLNKDPPYDPKESLRQKADDTIAYDDRNRRHEPYNSRSFDMRYAHNDEKEPERERERERNYDKRYDYRYDDRRTAAADYRDRRTLTHADSRDQRNSGLGRQDSGRSLTDMDTKRYQSSGNNSPTKSLSGNEFMRHNQISNVNSHYKSHEATANDRRPPVSSSHYYNRGSLQEGNRLIDERHRVSTLDLKGGEHSSNGRFSYQTHASESYTSSNGKIGNEDRGIDRTIPLGERIGIRIPLEDRISSPVHEKSKPPLYERIGDRMQEDRTVQAHSRRVSDSYPSGNDSSVNAVTFGQNVAELDSLSRDETIKTPLTVLRNSSYHTFQPRGVAPTADEQGDSENAQKRRYLETSRIKDEKAADSIVKGHYERPVVNLERERYPPDNRNGSSLSEREWRERSSYPPVPAARKAETFYDERFHEGREWTTSDKSFTSRPPGTYPSTDHVDDRFARMDQRSVRTRPRSPGLPIEPPDDLRPAKRVRDSSLYYDDRREYPYSSTEAYPPRGITPPPPSAASTFYDNRSGFPPRDPHDAYSDYDRAPPSDAAFYDRRALGSARPRSPPYSNRSIYKRPDMDRERFIPPPRTA